MRQFLAHFFKNIKSFNLSDAFNDGNPAEFIGLGAILNATKLVVKLLAPRTWLAVTEGV